MTRKVIGVEQLAFIDISKHLREQAKKEGCSNYNRFVSRRSMNIKEQRSLNRLLGLSVINKSKK
jgi:hypothetical protein